MLDDFLTPDGTALLDHFNHFATARGYVESMFVMMSSKERLDLDEDGALVMATMLLGGFAVELYLKAYLRKKEIEPHRMKTHDLKRLSNLCRKNDFKDVDKLEIKRLIKLFNESHKNGEFRYIENGKYNRQLCFLPVFFDWFSVLDSAVTEAVGARHYFGRSGDKGWKFPEDRSPHWRIIFSNNNNKAKEL